MAVTISRQSLTDDDGSGTTGTVVNAAFVTTIYDEIDALMATLFTNATTIKSTVVTSSLTSVGTITSGVWNAGAVTSSAAVTGTALIPSSSAVPTNGVNLPATNTLGLVTNSGLRWNVTADIIPVSASSGSLGSGAVPVNQLFLGHTIPLIATATASDTGTTAIFNASGYLQKLTSSERYKEHVTDWDVPDEALRQFLELLPKVWDYVGQKTGAVGFTSEQLARLPIVNAYGVSPLVNYDVKGRPDSNRDYGLIALLQQIAKQHDARLAALEERMH